MYFSVAFSLLDSFSLDNIFYFALCAGLLEKVQTIQPRASAEKNAGGAKTFSRCHLSESYIQVSVCDRVTN